MTMAIDWEKCPALAHYLEPDVKKSTEWFEKAMNRYRDRISDEWGLADMIRDVELPQLIADVRREALERARKAIRDEFEWETESVLRPAIDRALDALKALEPRND